MPRLDSLPFDLASSIFDYVELADFRQLRLTSSKVRKSTEEIFARRFFRVVSVMLIKDSMLALEEISQHQVFRQFVQKIYLYIDHVCPELVHGAYIKNGLFMTGPVSNNVQWQDPTHIKDYKIAVRIHSGLTIRGNWWAML